MSRGQALAQSVPDSLGCRWATAEAGERTFLAVLWPTDEVLVEVIRDQHGEPRRRVVLETPRYLSWRPVEVA